MENVYYNKVLKYKNSLQQVVHTMSIYTHKITSKNMTIKALARHSDRFDIYDTISNFEEALHCRGLQEEMQTLRRGEKL